MTEILKYLLPSYITIKVEANGKELRTYHQPSH